MKTPPKFSELPYERPDFEALQKRLDQLTQEARNAASYVELREVIDRFNAWNAQMMLPCQLAMTRCYLDASDLFYAEEMGFTGQGAALLDDAPFLCAVLESPFAPQLDEELGPNFRHILKDRFRLTAQGKELQAKLEELENRCQQLQATLRIPFRGEELSRGQINALLQDPDRDTRREAYLALGRAYVAQGETFQTLLGELVDTRIALARANGFEHYMDYANLAKGRRGYGQKELLDFCCQVREDMLPLLGELYRRQAERLGLDTLCPWDVNLMFPDGNAKPVGDASVLLERAKEMYDAISPEAGELFRTMADNGYIDITSSPNKIANMGFCEALQALKMPFIFGNCDGSVNDATTLTHEFGHAYQMWLCMTHQPVDQYLDMPNDVAEVPSKAMEQFTTSFAGLFFGNTAEKFTFHQLQYTVREICTFCANHEFESWLYENPQATGGERIARFNEIYRAYEAGVDFSGTEDLLAQGSVLFRTQGVYMFPAYVISYALSDMGALELREQARRDFPAAWANYRALCLAGGSRDYDQLMETAHLSTAYAPGAVKRAAQTVAEALGIELK